MADAMDSLTRLAYTAHVLSRKGSVAPNQQPQPHFSQPYQQQLYASANADMSGEEHNMLGDESEGEDEPMQIRAGFRGDIPGSPHGAFLAGRSLALPRIDMLAERPGAHAAGSGGSAGIGGAARSPGSPLPGSPRFFSGTAGPIHMTQTPPSSSGGAADWARQRNTSPATDGGGADLSYGGGASAGKRGGSSRRPVQFWAQFNDWWRTELERTGKRPGGEVVAEWYGANAASCWGDDAPTLEETRTHAKCLRSVGSIREYFRTYRARKKAKTNDDGGGGLVGNGNGGGAGGLGGGGSGRAGATAGAGGFASSTATAQQQLAALSSLLPQLSHLSALGLAAPLQQIAAAAAAAAAAGAAFRACGGSPLPASHNSEHRPQRSPAPLQLAGPPIITTVTTGSGGGAPVTSGGRGSGSGMGANALGSGGGGGGGFGRPPRAPIVTTTSRGGTGDGSGSAGGSARHSSDGGGGGGCISGPPPASSYMQQLHGLPCHPPPLALPPPPQLHAADRLGPSSGSGAVKRFGSGSADPGSLRTHESARDEAFTFRLGSAALPSGGLGAPEGCGNNMPAYGHVNSHSKSPHGGSGMSPYSQAAAGGAVSLPQQLLSSNPFSDGAAVVHISPRGPSTAGNAAAAPAAAAAAGSSYYHPQMPPATQQQQQPDSAHSKSHSQSKTQHTFPYQPAPAAATASGMADPAARRSVVSPFANASVFHPAMAAAAAADQSSGGSAARSLPATPPSRQRQSPVPSQCSGQHEQPQRQYRQPQSHEQPLAVPASPREQSSLPPLPSLSLQGIAPLLAAAAAAASRASPAPPNDTAMTEAQAQQDAPAAETAAAAQAVLAAAPQAQLQPLSDAAPATADAGGNGSSTVVLSLRSLMAHDDARLPELLRDTSREQLLGLLAKAVGAVRQRKAHEERLMDELGAVLEQQGSLQAQLQAQRIENARLYRAMMSMRDARSSGGGGLAPTAVIAPGGPAIGGTAAAAVAAAARGGGGGAGGAAVGFTASATCGATASPPNTPVASAVEVEAGGQPQQAQRCHSTADAGAARAAAAEDDGAVPPPRRMDLGSTAGAVVGACLGSVGGAGSERSIHSGEAAGAVGSQQQRLQQRDRSSGGERGVAAGGASSGMDAEAAAVAREGAGVAAVDSTTAAAREKGTVCSDGGSGTSSAF